MTSRVRISQGSELFAGIDRPDVLNIRLSLREKPIFEPIDFCSRLPRQCKRNKTGFNNSASAEFHVAWARGLQRCGFRNTYGECRMTDNFGKIMVFGDYEGNLKAIVDKLNSLRWSHGSVGGREWAVEKSSAAGRGAYKKRHKKRKIIVLNGDLPDPSLRPVGKIFVLKDGRRCFADDADASIIKQWEADKDDGAFDWDEYTLRELSTLISPHLHKGTIEFVAVFVSRGLVRHERLLVRSDGCAEWHVCASMNHPLFGDHWTHRDTEYYDPLVLVVPGARLSRGSVRCLRQAGYDTPALTRMAVETRRQSALKADYR